MQAGDEKQFPVETENVLSLRQEVNHFSTQTDFSLLSGKCARNYRNTGTNGTAGERRTNNLLISSL